MWGVSKQNKMASTRNSFVPRPMSFELLFLELREPLNGLWFECFEALKIDKMKLLRIRDKYMKDPKICVIEALRLWLVNTNPPPSWDSLVIVLRYVIMETELADRIERLYVDPTKAERHVNSSSTPKKVTYDDTKLSLGPMEPTHFQYLITDAMDILNDGSSCYALHFALTTLCCPDGSPFIDSKIISSTVTIDGIMMPLIFYNYITDLDIDLLVYVMKVLGVLGELDNALNFYYRHRKLGQPTLKTLRCIKSLFFIKCLFEQGHLVNPNFEMVVDLKKKLSAACQLNDFPYIIQYMGWTANPSCFYFQLPQTVMQTVRTHLKSLPLSFKLMNIYQIQIEIGSGRFCINHNE